MLRWPTPPQEHPIGCLTIRRAPPHTACLWCLVGCDEMDWFEVSDSDPWRTLTSRAPGLPPVLVSCLRRCGPVDRHQPHTRGSTGTRTGYTIAFYRTRSTTRPRTRTHGIRGPGSESKKIPLLPLAGLGRHASAGSKSIRRGSAAPNGRGHCGPAETQLRA